MRMACTGFLTGTGSASLRCMQIMTGKWRTHFSWQVPFMIVDLHREVIQIRFRIRLHLCQPRCLFTTGHQLRRLRPWPTTSTTRLISAVGAPPVTPSGSMGKLTPALVQQPPDILGTTSGVRVSGARFAGSSNPWPWRPSLDAGRPHGGPRRGPDSMVRASGLAFRITPWPGVQPWSSRIEGT